MQLTFYSTRKAGKRRVSTVGRWNRQNKYITTALGYESERILVRQIFGQPIRGPPPIKVNRSLIGRIWPVIKSVIS